MSSDLSVDLWVWLAVVGAILALLAVDLWAHRSAHVPTFREAAAWSALYVVVALAFGGFVWATYGATAGGEYLAGYLIEKSLAVDNVFVWAMLFTYFAVPREYQHRVLFYGVLGALVLRAGFIAAGAEMLDRFHWTLYLFGALLVLTGVKMARHRPEDADPARNPVVRWVQRVVPTTPEYDGQRFWVKRAGRWVATPLFIVLVAVETTDVIFAIDSIPAIFAITQEPFLVFTSNAFAILGLRAMYFLLAGLVHRFVHLRTGLALVLVLVGTKMLLLDVYKVPVWISLGAVATVISTSIWLSLRATRHLPPPTEPPAEPPTAEPEREVVPTGT